MRDLSDGELQILSEQEQDCREDTRLFAGIYETDYYRDNQQELDDLRFLYNEAHDREWQKRAEDEAEMAAIAEREQDAEQASWRANGGLPPFD